MDPILRRELEHYENYDVSWREALGAWWKGFSIRDAAQLDLASADEDGERYLSSFQQMLYIPPEPEHAFRVEDKGVFYDLTPDHLIPETYFQVEDLPPFFNGFVKPRRGVAGRGVERMFRHGEDLYIGERPHEQQLGRTDFRGYVFQEPVFQHEYATEINPHAANTLRFLTINPSDSEPFIASVVHRFGTEATAPTDNWSGGGCAVPVTLEGGILLYVYSMQNGSMHHSTEHPDSGVQITGKAVPNWYDVKETVLEVAEVHDELSYVGWDVVVQNDGEPVVLEGNAAPHLALQQLGGGLLTDPRVRAYFDSLDPHPLQRGN